MNTTEEAISDELAQSYRKHGDFASPLEGVAVIHEEWDEFVQEVRHGTIEAATKECVQVAAMAMKWLYVFGVYRDGNEDRTGSNRFGGDRGGLANRNPPVYPGKT